MSVRLLSVFRILGPVDLKNIRRDPLLGWVGVLPLVLVLLYRAVPLLREVLLERFAFDLTPYYPLIAGSFLTAAPGMVGMVVGFLLLDERDEGVATAIAVTPLAPASYLSYRLSAPIAAGLMMTVLAYPFVGLAPLAPPTLIVAAAAAALVAPLTAMFLKVFAENKVSGFAIVKVLNLIGIAPIAAWFVPEPWQWLAGIVPSYWPMKIVWLASEGRAWGAHAAAGVAVSGALLMLLLRYDRRRGSR